MTHSITATDLPRVMQCIGSIDMPPSLPPSVTDEAREEGTAAHWLAQVMFDGVSEVRAGMRAGNGYIITDEMIEYTTHYVSALDCGQMEVNTSWGDIRGRCDHLKHASDTLTIDEFKTGFRVVEPFENWTLLSHAIGWCIMNHAAPSRIVLRVHQPRAFHHNGPLRQWVLDYPMLMSYHARIVERLAQPADTLTTGPMCLKCAAHSTCPAARERDMRAIDATAETFVDELPDDALASQYDLLDYALKSMEARRDALGELMTHRISEGHAIQGYALRPRYGQTKWNTGITGALVTVLTGVNCTKDAIVTPAQARRLGVPETVITSLTYRPNIGTKLTRIDANREASEAFGDGPRP